MSKQSTGAYSVLASAYDDAGFSNYAAAITPLLLTHMQQTGWVGRRILDLGCGTGASTSFFASSGMDTIGIEVNAEMLKVAHLRVEGTGYLADLQQDDIRQIDYPPERDLVYCIGNVLNEMGNMREIEVVFKKAYAALQPGRRFIFDLLTLRGLGEYLGTGQEILDVSDRLFITLQSQFQFETMSLRQAFTVFRMGAPEHWERENAFLTLRGYPLNGITTLLERSGFQLMGLYDTQLKEFDPLNDHEGRVIVVAQKPAA